MSKGKKIKELREKYELTQEQLAQKLETTKQTIFKYEIFLKNSMTFSNFLVYLHTNR